MRTIDRDQIFEIIAIQQTLYDYCHELDDGGAGLCPAENVENGDGGIVP